MAPSSWSLQLAWEEIGFLLALAGAYAAAVRGRPLERSRAVAFGLGLVLAHAAVVSPIATIALHYLLSAHLLQTVILAEWASALLVLGVPAALAARIGRVRAIAALTQPLVALPLWLGAYALWHIPLLYEAALRNRLLLDLEHLTYLAAGLLFWWPVFQDVPRALSSGARAAYLFAAFVLASPLGLLLALLPDPIYGVYEDTPRLWGLSPLADQQIAGVVMTGSETILLFFLFTVFFLRFLSEEG